MKPKKGGERLRLGVLLGEFMKELSLKEAVHIALALEYSCVELPANDPASSCQQYALDSTQKLGDWIRELGLEASAFQCHFHKGLGGENAEGYIDHVCKMAQIADCAGIGVVHTVSGIWSEFDPVQKERPYDPKACVGGPEWNRMVSSYRTILQRCRGLNVRIAIEPVFVYMVCNAQTTGRLLEELGKEELFINFDPSHFPYHMEEANAFLDLFGSKIIHAHAKDARVETPEDSSSKEDDGWPMKDGNVFHFAAPGRGVLDWPSLLDKLSDIGYDDVLSLEMGHGYLDDALQAATKNIAFFRSLGVE